MSKTTHYKPSPDPLYFFDQSETGKLARSLDWSKHPLGSPEHWPGALKTALGILFRNRHPMFLFWGPRHTCFYNDSYMPSFGAGRHPSAMGQDGVDCWPEIWSVIAPQIHQVMEGGKATWNVDQLLPIFRNGKLEDVYWTYSYSPVLAEDGRPHGVIVTVTETTTSVVAARQIRESAERLRATFEHSSVGVTLLSLQGQFLETNPALRNMLGYTEEEFQRVGFANITHPDDVAHALEGVQQLVRGEIPALKLEKRCIQKNGEYLWTQCTASCTRSENGTPLAIAAVIEDITDRRAAILEIARAHEQLHEFFMQAPAPMVILEGPDHFFTLANPPYERLIGRKANGKTLSEIFAAEEVGHFVKILDDVYQTGIPFTGRAVPLDLPDENQVLHTLYLDFGYHPFRNSKGVIKGILAIVNDVTEQVLARQQLEEFTDELELSKRQALIGKDEAERANTLKTAFLTNMSHEIRTPLGIMLGFADLITDPEIAQKEKTQFAQSLKRNGEQLTVLINDILDLSKVEAGHLTVEVVPFSLRDLLDDTLSAMAVKAREKGLKLELEMKEDRKIQIFSDPMRVRQILFNIIGNAIKFTAHGEITVSILRCDSELEIEIKDTGIGIAPEHQGSLFKPFSQADDSITRRFGGTGLGLALSKRLAELLGGELTLKTSSPSDGSVFSLLIANHKTETNRPVIEAKKNSPTATAESANLDQISVLLVEDSPDNRLLITRLLTKHGATVTHAENGLQGVEMAFAGTHDIVLMDVQMPILDGYSATQRLRDGGYRKPIIALTAHAMNEVREKCMQVGCSDYLPKPIDAKILIQKIARLASREFAV